MARLRRQVRRGRRDPRRARTRDREARGEVQIKPIITVLIKQKGWALFRVIYGPLMSMSSWTFIVPEAVRAFDCGSAASHPIRDREERKCLQAEPSSQ